MFMPQRLLTAFLSGVLAFASPWQLRAMGQAEMTSEQVMLKAAEAVQWTRNMHVRMDYHGKLIRLAGGVQKGAAIKEVSGWEELYVTGNLLHAIKQNDSVNGVDGAHLEILVTPNRRILWVKNSNVQYTEARSVIDDAVAFDRALPDFGWYLDGVFATDAYPVFDFATAIRVGRIQSSERDEIVDGLPCKVVEIDGDSWILRVWAAPSRDFNFAKCTLDCKASAKQSHNEVDKIEFQRLSTGQWVIQGGRLVKGEPQNPGLSTRYEVTVHRTLIDPSPDFDKLKAFELPPIPNGEPVERTDVDQAGKEINSGLNYTWKDGTVVPAYDPRLIDRIRRAVERSDSQTLPSSDSGK